MTSGALTRVGIRRASVQDAPSLTILAATTFGETFAADNDPANMAAYTATAFSEARQCEELLDPHKTVLFAERGGELVGYAMLSEGRVPECVGPYDAIEIARLYAATRSIGSGIGSLLMDACLAEASARGRERIWLGVWERNARAIAFYRRWLFRDVGSQPFELGTDVQTDRVMARDVTATC